ADDGLALLRGGPPVPARPLRAGHLSTLRLRRRARRPVRQLRPPARPGRADQPGLPLLWHAAGVPRYRALLPEPDDVQRAVARLGEGQRLLAPHGPAVHAWPARSGAAAAADHAGHRLGRVRTA